MLSHLDINCLTISNSIEINQLDCVTEETSTKSRDTHCSVSSQANPFLLHVINKYILQTYNCKIEIGN